MLFETSIWIDYFQGKTTPFSLLLKHLLEESDEFEVDNWPTIYQEILQGIRNELIASEIIELLMSVRFLDLDSYIVANKAAKIYRNLRQVGVTIKKPNDCLIAAFAIHFNLMLVQNDVDSQRIAEKTSLKLFTI
jgi:predicted nucleic acid-binding protein